MTTVQIPGRFYEDWEAAAEDLVREGDPVAVSAIDKIDSGKRTKRGKGYVISAELTPDEIKFLTGEAKYRMEYNSPLYCDDDIDHVAQRAAKRLYESLLTLSA